MRHRAGQPGLGLRRAAALLLAGLVVVVAITVDALAGRVPPGDAPPVAQDEPSSGLWYCPVTPEEDERAVVSVTATGQADSTVTLQHVQPGATTERDPVAVAAGETVEVPIPAARAAQPVAVRWTGSPVAVSYRIRAERSVGAPCVSEPAPRWHLTGFDTSLGSRAYLHLFNPFGIDAVARVSFGTPEGPVDLVRTESISVRAGTSLRLDLNRYQPEETDLGATVEVLGGRVVAQGEVQLAPPSQERGPTGRVLLQAREEPANQAAFAYGQYSDNAGSWLSLYNPGAREAAIQVAVSEPRGRRARASEVSVPAGGTLRLRLRELSSADVFGVSVASVNRVPVIATRFTDIREDGDRSVAASVGAVPARTWALPGAPTTSGPAGLHLYNPGEEAVSVRVDAGPGAPDTWNAITLEPNAHAGLPLSKAAAGGSDAGVLVDADAPVVAELKVVAERRGATNAYTYTGVPETAWVGPTARPPVRRDPFLDTVPAAP